MFRVDFVFLSLPFLCRDLGLGAVRRIDRILVGQKSPEDPGVLVRDRNGRSVVPPPLVESQDPGTSSLGFPLSRGDFHDRLHKGSSSMDQKCPKIIVSPLGDPKENILASAGVLSGYQPKERSKLASILESGRIPHKSQQNRGSQNSHAGNGHKPLAHRMRLGQRIDPAVEPDELLLQAGKLRHHRPEGLTQGWGQSRLRILRQPGYFPLTLLRRLSQKDPVLRKNATEMVDRGRSIPDPKLSRPMKALDILGLFRLHRNGRD